MKRYLMVFLLIGLFVVSFSSAYAVESFQAEDVFGLPLCLPGMPNDGSCLFYGPAQTVAEMQTAGFPYPIRDLPAAQPSADLGVMPIFVAKINLDEALPALIYASFEDAVAEVNPVSQIDPGSMRFVRYIDRLDHNGKPYLQLSSGGWMRAAPAAYTSFQGLEFFENPRNNFGWIIDQIPSHVEPSFSAATTDNRYITGDVVQVFNEVEAEGVTWYQIGFGEWVDGRKTKIVEVNLNKPEGVTADRWIELNLFQQTLAVYEDGQLRFATLMASGRDPFYTKPGVFQIYEKKALETMTGSFEADRSDYYYLQDVPWTMYYDEARALHAVYWHTYLGTPQSHGCVNLSPGDARWLFEWAEEGDYVWVHDPSGQTPLDPQYYGPGAP